jgi:hypothetical protein
MIVSLDGSYSTAVAESGEQCWYRGRIDGVGGEARMQIFRIPPRAIAENNGAKVVGRGGGIIVKMVGGSGIGAESLASPKKEVLCRVLICFLLTEI